MTKRVGAFSQILFLAFSLMLLMWLAISQPHIRTLATVGATVNACVLFWLAFRYRQYYPAQ